MGEQLPSTNEVSARFTAHHSVHAPAHKNISRDLFNRWHAATLADAWDEGHADGITNEHEHRPGKQIANPYRSGDE